MFVASTMEILHQHYSIIDNKKYGFMQSLCSSTFLTHAVQSLIRRRTGGEENKHSSGHVRIQINVNNTWMVLPVR